MIKSYGFLEFLLLKVYDLLKEIQVKLKILDTGHKSNKTLSFHLIFHAFKNYRRFIQHLTIEI